jgi:hypothetical protein
MLTPRISRQETIALDSAARHQNKHPEGRIAEPESLWQRLREHSNEQINILKITTVDPVNLVRKLLVTAGQFEESGWRFHVEEASELTVSRDSTFAVAQDVHGGNVSRYSVRGGDLTQEVGVVVVGYCSRVINAEGIESIAEGSFRINCVLGFLKGKVGDWCCFCMLACCGVEERDVV